MMQLRRTEFMGDKLSTNVQNQCGSTKCISRLTKSIIYNIYYERRLLPEQFFCTRLIEGIPVQELVPNEEHPRVLKLNEWIEDLLRSIRKKELKNVCLELITLDSNELVECYTLKYSYRDEHTSKNIPEQYTANSIQTMLRNMKNVFKTKLNPLIDKRNLRFRLTADSRGFGRQAAVFTQEKKRRMQFASEDGKLDFEMGTVCTPFHRLILRVTAEVKEHIVEDDTENDVIIIEEDSQNSIDPEIIELDDSSDDEMVPISSHSSNKENMDTESTNNKFSSIVEMSNVKMSCICGTNIRDSIFTVMQCKNCSRYQHAECYGIHKFEKIPPRHLCHDCSCLMIDSFIRVRSPASGEIITQDNYTHTDPRLIEYTIAELKDIGRMRLILLYIFREKQAPLQFMKANFEMADIEKIMKKLLEHKILIEKNNTLFLNPAKVNLFIRKHFKPRFSINKFF